MIEATYVKARRTAARVRHKGARAVSDGQQVDCIPGSMLCAMAMDVRYASPEPMGSAVMMREGARVLLADLLVDKPLLADWFGATSAKGKISACIPAGAKRSHPAIHDVLLHKQQHKSENMFGCLKEWSRAATRYERCAHTVFSAICSAATGILEF